MGEEKKINIALTEDQLLVLCDTITIVVVDKFAKWDELETDQKLTMGKTRNMLLKFEAALNKLRRLNKRS